MGTRNLTMVISNNQIKVAQYGQWDGYPSGQGLTALATLKEIAEKNNWDSFRNKVNSLRWFTEAEYEDLKKMSDDELMSKYPQLSRDWCAAILEAIYTGQVVKEERDWLRNKSTVVTTTFPNIECMQDYSGFAADSLFCEWAYVIDLDKMTFEVFKGFNKEPLVEGDRFYELQDKLIAEKAAKGRQVEYYPVKLVKSYDLNNLPDGRTFCNECEEREEEDVEDDSTDTAEA